MTELFEQTKLAQMRAAHPDWIWNRSDTHTFVAVPGSHESFKTPVEPGNSFSPGPGTYGVSTWIFVDGRLHAPEEKPLAELHWRWQDGGLPVLISEWAAGPVAVTLAPVCRRQPCTVRHQRLPARSRSKIVRRRHSR